MLQAPIARAQVWLAQAWLAHCQNPRPAELLRYQKIKIAELKQSFACIISNTLLKCLTYRSESLRRCRVDGSAHTLGVFKKRVHEQGDHKGAFVGPQ
jgi:hypothetical protein